MPYSGGKRKWALMAPGTHHLPHLPAARASPTSCMPLRVPLPPVPARTPHPRPLQQQGRWHPQGKGDVAGREVGEGTAPAGGAPTPRPQTVAQWSSPASGSRLAPAPGPSAFPPWRPAAHPRAWTGRGHTCQWADVQTVRGPDSPLQPLSLQGPTDWSSKPVTPRVGVVGRSAAQPRAPGAMC